MILSFVYCTVLRFQCVLRELEFRVTSFVFCVKKKQYNRCVGLCGLCVLCGSKNGGLGWKLKS